MSEVVVRVAQGVSGALQVKQAQQVAVRIGGGVPGPQGLSAEGSHYQHNQVSPSATWTINHNLGFIPNVTLIDSAGDEFEADIEYGAMTVIVTLPYALSGIALLS